MTNPQTENTGSEAELENLLRRINALTATSDSNSATGQSGPSTPAQNAVNTQSPSAHPGAVATFPGEAQNRGAVAGNAPQPAAQFEHASAPQPGYQVNTPQGNLAGQAGTQQPSVAATHQTPSAQVPPVTAPAVEAGSAVRAPAAPPMSATEAPAVQAPDLESEKASFVMPNMAGNEQLGTPSTVPGGPGHVDGARDKDLPFRPFEPQSFAEAKLNETEVEQLILKFLFGRGEVSGRGIAEQICLPFGLLDSLLLRLKQEQLVGYRDAAAMNDYVYVLTDLGRERARRFLADGSYCGSATVSLEDYINSVRQQSLGFQYPSRQDLLDAFSDLLINEDMFKRLGPAIQLGSWYVPVRITRQRENEYRRTDHTMFREIHLYSTCNWTSGRDRSCL